MTRRPSCPVRIDVKIRVNNLRLSNVSKAANISGSLCDMQPYQRCISDDIAHNENSHSLLPSKKKSESLTMVSMVKLSAGHR